MARLVCTIHMSIAGCIALMTMSDYVTADSLAEAFVKHMIEHLFKNCARDLQFFDERVEKGLRAKLEAVAKAEFGVIDYTEAIKILENSGRKWDHPISWGKDLQTEHERFLTEEYAKKPVFVVNYPRSFKPFYMYCNDDEKTVACMDLLVPRVGELIGRQSAGDDRRTGALKRNARRGTDPRHTAGDQRRLAGEIEACIHRNSFA